VAEGAGDIGTGTGTLARAAPGCNNNFDIWSVGTRLQYDWTKTLYMGVEFLYQHLDSASLPGGVLSPTNTTALLPANNDLACATGGVSGAAPCAIIKSMNNLAVTFRMHKDFLP
jgi:maltoporin